MIASHSLSEIWWKLGIFTCKFGLIIEGLLKKESNQSGLALRPSEFKLGGAYSG